jgi:hypothetical protein
MFIPLSYRNSLILFFSKRALLWLFNVAGNDKTLLCLHVKCPTILPHFNQIWSFLKDFREVPIIKFNGNLSNGSCASTRGQIDGPDKANRHYCHYANVPKNTNLMIAPCCLSVHALWPFINRLINNHKTWYKLYATQHRPEEVNKPPIVLTTFW